MKKDQEHYEQFNKDHETDHVDNFKLPDLDMLDELWEKHE